jgi:PAS domain S-box-containing protein
MDKPEGEQIADSMHFFIRQEQVRMLFGNLSSSLLTSFIIASIWLVAHWFYLDAGHSLLLMWFFSMVLLMAFRGATLLAFNRVRNGQWSDVYWSRVHLLGSTLSALLWAASSLLFFQHADGEQQVFLAFVIAGICAGAVTTLSYQRLPIILFTSLCLLPLSMQFAFSEGNFAYPMSLMVLMFWLGLLISAGRWYQQSENDLERRYRSQRRERILQGKTVRLQTLIDSALDAIVVANRQGKIQVFNPAAERIFGYTQDEAIGANVEILMADSHAEHHQQYISSYFKRGTGYLLGATRALEGRRKSGEIFPMEVSLTEMVVNEKVMFAALMRDITLQRELEHDLMDAKEMAENANRAKSEFLSSMSHEIRTPMNAIVGFADLLENDDRLVDDQIDFVREIKHAGRHLVSLVNTMVESRQISMKVDISQCQCSAFADSRRLKQVLLNLLSNAVKYNKDGGRINVWCERETSLLRIYIQDTGVGISDNLQAKLFKPFERLSAERSEIEGTGLGLMLSKNFMEVMNGKLCYSSTADKGSLFWIELSAPELEACCAVDDGEVGEK